jgi:hypothetical protein
MRFDRSKFGVMAMLPLIGLLTLTGCSGVLSATMEEKLAAGGTADDHLAAARLYQDKARELNANAAQYETALSKIGPYEDTKGFRRGALTAAAQENRYEAKQMQEQYATHLAEAQALYGKVQPH